jgi:uncharacterized protein YyaL (SSP411 family)
MSDPQPPNRLIHETSPYLLQHAHNPVDWYPWGEEAFQKAKQEDRPILLSCGYSACHWCHVMERESFENPEIAALMNQYFVNIKVDREERPDIDQLYQQAVQMITGQGGWPLTVFLDHERKPFFGGTYFPPVPMYGRTGFPQILQAIHDKWQGQREDIAKVGMGLSKLLQLAVEKPIDAKTPEKELALKAAYEIYQAADFKSGGFGKAPKFPNPSLLQLLLRSGVVYNQSPLREHVLFTLKQMARGGIYDQLGGGFHRYSTDAGWLVPHFEKMLYDNAQLLKIYAIGYQLSNVEEFKNVVFETADYIRREMTTPEGGFYATQDADSAGTEGKFFIWDLPEVKRVLETEDAQLIIDYYRLSVEGNFEGANILNRLQEPVGRLKDLRFNPGLQQKIKIAKEKLFLVREERVKPFRDEKVITGWNGLMISGFAYTYQVFRREEDYRSAYQAAQFILASMRLSDGRLRRIYKDGQAKIDAMLDDYVFLVQGLIDLYEADFDEVWLQRSLELVEIVIRDFSSGQGHYFVTAETDNLFARPLSAEDQAIPGGVSVHCENMLRLAAFTGQKALYQETERILAAYSQQMENENWGHAGLISALDMYYQGFKEFTFISEGKELPEILNKLRQVYIPYRILAWRNGLHKGIATHPAKELFRDRETVQGKPTCYTCFSNNCLEPVTDWEALHTILDDSKTTVVDLNIK